MSYRESANGIVLDAKSYQEKMKEDAAENADGLYPPTMFVGLGGTGAKSLIHLRQMLHERYSTVELAATAFLSIDTDIRSVGYAAEDIDNQNNPLKDIIEFKDHERINLNANINSIVPAVSKYPHIQEWWDGNTKINEDFDVETGAGQIRPLAKLLVSECHEDIMARVKAINNRIRTFTDSGRVLSDEKTTIYIVAGLAGGTGSGCFQDVAAMIKSALGPESCIIKAYFVLPDAYITVESASKYEKIAANGAAALREINHYLTNKFHADWGKSRTPHGGLSLFEQIYLVGGKNADGTPLTKLEDAYRAIGEALFLRYSGGSLPGFIDSVRVNRNQYLNSTINFIYEVPDENGESRETKATEWKRSLSTFGISKIVYPAWRLLHYARYDLGIRMLELMDPTVTQNAQATVGLWRDRFLMRWGIFQGDYKDHENPEAYKQGVQHLVQDAMLKLPGNHKGGADIPSAIGNLRQMLISNAEGMYGDKKTHQFITQTFDDLRKKLGDPKVAKSAGDWAETIQNNRKLMSEQLRTSVDGVIEDFYKNYGLTSVKAIIEQCLDELDKDADTARYKRFMEHQVNVQAKKMKEVLPDYNNRLTVAVDSEKGFFSSAEVHKTAVEEVANRMASHWSFAFKSYAAEEGAKLLEYAAGLLRNKLNEIEATIKQLFEIKNVFMAYRKHFKDPQITTMFQELPTSTKELDKLLEPYLGQTKEAQKQTLEIFYKKMCRQLELTSLRELQNALFTRKEWFVKEIQSRLYMALKGTGKGQEVYTSAFYHDDSPPPDDSLHTLPKGFIVRHNILDKLKNEDTMNSFKSMIQDLFDLGRPLVQKGDDIPGLQYDVHTDTFVGVQQYKDQALTFNKLKETLETAARIKGETPVFAGTNDPTEIILYVETHAFPVFYIEGIYKGQGFKDAYNAILFDENKKAALHLHKDYHEFSPIVPYDDTEIKERQDVLRQLLLGQLLNRIQTVAQNKNIKDNRHAYVWKRTKSGQINRQPISVEEIVLHKYTKDKKALMEMKHELQAAVDLFIAYGGTYADLYTLVDYWVHMLFAVEMPVATGGLNPLPKGSMHNLILENLRTHFRDLSMKHDNKVKSRPDLFNRVQANVRDLTKWTRPICESEPRRGKNKDPLPVRTKPDDVFRPWEYDGGTNLADFCLENYGDFYLDNGWLDKYDPSLKGKMPFLGINWEYYEPTKYDFKLIHGLEEFNTSAEAFCKRVLEYVKDGEFLASDLFGSDFQAAEMKSGVPQSFKHISAFDEIVRELSKHGLETGTSPTGSTGAPPPPPSTGETYHLHSLAGEGEFSVAEIAKRISGNPDGSHNVWKDGMAGWSSWETVPEIKAAVDALGAKPPPPPISKVYHYTRDQGQTVQQLGVDDIAKLIAADTGGDHHLWEEGWSVWKSWQEVSDVASTVEKLSGGPPPFGGSGGPPPFSS